MKVKQLIATGLVSGITAFLPCKAQRAVQLVPETGITGALKTEMSYIGGLNLQITKGKNFSDFFAGLKVQHDKQASFAGMFVNNYSWTETVSSWLRGTVIASRRGTKSVLETAPVRINVPAGKFNLSLSPSHVMYNDFKDGTTTQAISTIFQTTYSINPKNQLFFEAAYSSEPVKNLSKTSFGKPEDNISYMVTCTHSF
jgi:hypothetical protein